MKMIVQAVKSYWLLVISYFFDSQMLHCGGWQPFLLIWNFLFLLFSTSELSLPMLRVELIISGTAKYSWSIRLCYFSSFTKCYFFATGWSCFWLWFVSTWLHIRYYKNSEKILMVWTYYAFFLLDRYVNLYELCYPWLWFGY